LVTDLKGKEGYLKSGDIIAAAPKVFPEMFKTINACVHDSAYLNKTKTLGK